jgi:hypothetical protein
VSSAFATTAAPAQASAAAAKPSAGVNRSARRPAAMGAISVIAARASSKRAFAAGSAFEGTSSGTSASAHRLRITAPLAPMKQAIASVALGPAIAATAAATNANAATACDTAISKGLGTRSTNTPAGSEKRSQASPCSPTRKPTAPGPIPSTRTATKGSAAAAS